MSSSLSETKGRQSFFWLDFAKFVTGNRPLTPESIRSQSRRHAIASNYGTLAKQFNSHLAVRSRSTDFIEYYLVGTQQRPMPIWRREEIRLAYKKLVEDRSCVVRESLPPVQRFISEQFYLPLRFDVVLDIGKKRNVFVKYMFTYSDTARAKGDELDVLLTLATKIYPEFLRQRAKSTITLFDEFPSDDDYEFWAMHFASYGYTFHSVSPKKIDDLYRHILLTTTKIDKLLAMIREADKQIREDFERNHTD